MQHTMLDCPLFKQESIEANSVTLIFILTSVIMTEFESIFLSVCAHIPHIFDT